jgi:hypothetical protein
MWQKANKHSDKKALALVNKIMLIPDHVKMAALKLYYKQCKSLYNIAFVQWLIEQNEDLDKMESLNHEKLMEIESTLWQRHFGKKTSFMLNMMMSDY